MCIRDSFISREDFNSGYALYAFDLSADLGEDDHFSLVRQGSVRLALKFAAALAATVSVVVYAEFRTSSRWTGTETSSLTTEYEFGRDRSLPKSTSA